MSLYAVIAAEPGTRLVTVYLSDPDREFDKNVFFEPIVAWAIMSGDNKNRQADGWHDLHPEPVMLDGHEVELGRRHEGTRDDAVTAITMPSGYTYDFGGSYDTLEDWLSTWRPKSTKAA